VEVLRARYQQDVYAILVRKSGNLLSIDFHSFHQRVRSPRPADSSQVALADNATIAITRYERGVQADVDVTARERREQMRVAIVFLGYGFTTSF